MRIYLFLNDKVLTFTLPSEIAGSFSFDELEDEEDKLINIEARDSQWVLYSTEDVKVMQGTMAISAVPLQENQFYILSRDGKSYLIHAVALLDKHMVAYNYQKNVQLVIGNGENCNVRYACGLIQGVAAVVHYVEDTLTLEKMAKVPIYVNNQIVKENKYALQIGDTIHLYGFKITILPNILLMNKILEGRIFFKVS